MATSEDPPPTVAHRESRTLGATERECASFVREAVARAGAEGVVVPLDGGVRSTTAATLAVDALGAGAVYGLVLPGVDADEGDRRDAQAVAEDLGVDFRTVDVQPLVDACTAAMSAEVWLRVAPGARWERTDAHDPVRTRDAYPAAEAALADRLRMAAAAFEADTTDRLLVGAADRTALLVGGGGESAVGAADLLPLGDIYVTEVRALAREVGVPERIVRKPAADRACPRPDAGETSPWEDAGLGEGSVDSVLWLLVEEGAGVAEAATALGVAPAAVEALAERAADSRRARTGPPTPADVQNTGN